MSAHREVELWERVSGGGEFNWLVWDPNVGAPGEGWWYETRAEAELRLSELDDRYAAASASHAGRSLPSLSAGTDETERA